MTGHDYGISPTHGVGGINLAGYTVECSCGFSELVPWVGHVWRGPKGVVHEGETPRECREHAAQVAFRHIGSDMELSTRASYRTRQFVSSTEGMAEMFPGAK